MPMNWRDARFDASGQEIPVLRAEPSPVRRWVDAQLAEVGRKAEEAGQKKALAWMSWALGVPELLAAAGGMGVRQPWVKPATATEAHGISKRGTGGRYMRGPQTDQRSNVPELRRATIVPEDEVASFDEAVSRASSMQWLEPTVSEKRNTLRYSRDKSTGAFGNEKMKYPNESYPEGRNTCEKGGCGRQAFAETNTLPKWSEGACYGGSCYAEAGGKRYGRTVSGKPAEVSKNLQDFKGQDIRLGVDTDGSAWTAKPEIMDALLKANPGVVTVYSSAYHQPPPPHALAERSIVNVTVSGWHPIQETVRRIQWAEEARQNGWNVILREVTADPEAFAKDAGRYNRFHSALKSTDFYVMEQPLHKGSKYGKALELPACCNNGNCENCAVAEGTGKDFLNYWGIKDEPKDRLFPGLGPWPRKHKSRK